MRRQLLIQYCVQCGAVLVRTKTGAVCPRGHGRIVQLATDPWSGGYPEAERIAGTRRYRLEGLAGEYQTAVARQLYSSWFARRNGRRTPDVREDDWVIGRWRQRLVWFRPCVGVHDAPADGLLPDPRAARLEVATAG